MAARVPEGPGPLLGRRHLALLAGQHRLRPRQPRRRTLHQPAHRRPRPRRPQHQPHHHRHPPHRRQLLTTPNHTPAQAPREYPRGLLPFTSPAPPPPGVHTGQPSMCCFSVETSLSTSPLRTAGLFQAGLARVADTTHLGRQFSLSASSPLRDGHRAASRW
jgi:hypothetical protein